MTASVGVGLIGLGTVGSAVARRLLNEWELLGERAGAMPMLRRVAVRNPGRARELDLRTARLDDDPEALIDDESVGLVVEVMGGVDRASELIERALRAGKPVVTANKAAMAAHGIELAALARNAGVSLRYEAAVGAAIPVVALLSESLLGDRVSSLEMIINGTTNVILTRMESDSLQFAVALAEAQARGFAEADPSADIDGGDAAAKLVLLSRLAMGGAFQPGDVATTGIRGMDPVDIACADSMDASVKLVALAQRVGDRVALGVRPTVVVAGHPLYGIDGAENAVVITSDLAGRLVLRGPGAGGDATASAVVSDIVMAVRAPAQAPAVPVHDVTLAGDGEVERGGYVRVQLTSVAEADHLVAQALEDRGIAVHASTVISGADGMPAEMAVLTAAVTREVRDNAVETLDSLAAVSRVATVMDSTGAG
ncbi:MAG: homoserine dehydrogenase [Candidatus Dormibacteraeota bacterium]|nr:homoserine dehydrogenase [Candidatus Dormibacteraeota bacterium]